MTSLAEAVLVAVMVAAVFCNIGWSAVLEPQSTFRVVGQFATQGCWAARHLCGYLAVGSDRLRLLRDWR